MQDISEIKKHLPTRVNVTIKQIGRHSELNAPYIYIVLHFYKSCKNFFE